MKTLELNQMEKVSGAVDCSTGFGISAGVSLIGLAIIIGSGPVGWGIGAALYLAGGATAGVNGTLNC